MADHPGITPNELAEALRVYSECGSFTETARRLGRSEAGVRLALRRHFDTKRNDAHTRALAKAECDARRAVERARAKLEAALDTTGDVKELAAVAAQIHDNARATTQMRVAHSKLTGDHAPEKHEHAVDSVAEIARRIARLAEPDDAGEGAHGPH